MKESIIKRLKSNTYRLNVASAIIAMLLSNLPQFGSYSVYAFLILNTLNLMIREFSTNGPISEK